MNSIILIALGSGLCGVVRHLLSGWLSRHSGNAEAIRSFAVIGFCGGFTTFSTFSNETFCLLGQGHWGAMFVYVGLSVMAGWGAVALGYLIMK